MLERAFFGQIVAELAAVDPHENGMKAGFEIDMEGFIPDSVKGILSDCMNKKRWHPVKGVTISSRKPIFPVYQGTTTKGYMHFKFPSNLVINVTDYLVVRHIDIQVTEMFLKVDLSELKLSVRTWPDVTIKL